MQTLILVALGLFGIAAITACVARWPSSSSDIKNSANTEVTPRTVLWPLFFVTAAGLCITLASLYTLLTGKTAQWQGPWALPFGEFLLHFDPLAAWFAMLLCAVAFLGTWYGCSGKCLRGNNRSGWAGYFLLCTGMLLLLLAADAVLFLIAWEIMSVAAWVLIMNRPRERGIPRAGWFYFIVTEASTACLIPLFLILEHAAGSFSFAAIDGVTLSPAALTAVFILAVLGFGSKAGFFSSHLWMPEAYDAAAGHHAALLSAIMSKLSFYAFLRVAAFFHEIPAWWGGALIAIGILTALHGVILALLQNNLRRLLAYSSMENLGLICLALGFYLLGNACGAAWGGLALCGMLFHIWHHGICKTGLFLEAEEVAAATGSISLDSLGGLQKKLPRTALAFAVCAAAICTLPPLSGFAGECLMITAGLSCFATANMNVSTPVIIAAFALCGTIALTGGFAAWAFAKAYGTAFLGTPRNDITLKDTGDRPLPALAAAGLCFTLGIAWWLLLPLLRPIAAELTAGASIHWPWNEWQQGQIAITLAGVILTFLCILIASWRSRRQAQTTVAAENTWSCGYSKPTAKIQYTGVSFVQPLTTAFEKLLRPAACGQTVQGYFPNSASYETTIKDRVLHQVYRPLFHQVSRLFACLRLIQHGKTHLYIFYIMLALAAALAWGLA